MSGSKPHDDERQSLRDDLEEAVLAADDTGMVRSEADLVTAEFREALEIPIASGETANEPR